MAINVIQIANIETELARLWEEQKARHRQRASLFTLIVYVSNVARARAFHELIKCVIAKFPCRIIFIHVNPKAEDSYLRASASIEVAGTEDSTFACDQILIEVTPDQRERVPYLVLPHLEPDLPIYLLWGEDPTLEHAVLPHFESLAQRLIFNADCTDDLQSLCQRMALLIQTKQRCEMIDMQWLLTHGWRQALEQVIGEHPLSEWLMDQTEIKITYHKPVENGKRLIDLQALYLTNWLATQLKWDFVKQERKEDLRTIYYRHSQGQCRLLVKAGEKADQNPGAILGVEVNSPNEQCFLIEPLYKMQKVAIKISCADRCEVPYTLPMATLTRTFPYAKELFFDPPSEQYAAMIKTLSKVKW